VVSGQRAFELGMVDRVVPSLEALDGGVDEIVQRLLSGGPQAIAATKKLLNELDGSGDAEVVKRGADLSAKVVSLPETRASLRAKFASKG
jgi:methylglutaconyl-CoA hydratase